ncbi:GNAT family N-acetyltransferase [Ferrithrix thermotolerans]|uniref:GNAT family N-acetyltransferase n=1 Tax=Ferrithrix thermotolerans TaxID=209649 RepID=UPI0015C03908|nr:GNAT family N-acetyltransferase [Ferrithrix thermotolerans]
MIEEFNPEFPPEFLPDLRREMRLELLRSRGGPELLEEIEHRNSTGTLSDGLFGFYWAYHMVPVGFVVGEFVKAGASCVVSELFVSEKYRRLGGGGDLLQAVIDLATAKGCKALEVSVLPGDRASKSIMESYGLKARAIVMQLLLS